MALLDAGELHAADPRDDSLGSGSRAEGKIAPPAAPLPPQPPMRMPHYAPDETVPGLECHYGTFAYCYSGDPTDNVRQRARRPACHNPTETPAERHPCAACGGCYCSIHAAPADHDCAYVIPISNG